MAVSAEPTNRSWLINYTALIGVTGAVGLAILGMMMLDEHVSLAIIFAVGALALSWVTGICDVQGTHAVWRMLAQIVMLGAMMYYLYARGDIYVPQAVLMSLGAILIMNPLSFASEAAENSEQARLVPLIGLLNSVYFCYVAWELPNPGVFQLSLFLGVLSLVLIITPLPHMGVVLGSFAWAVGAYAWLGNASPAMVLAPVTLVMLDVIWTLFRRLITKDGREEMPTRGSFWTKLNAWTLPAEDMVTQRLGSLSSPSLAIFWIFSGALLSVIAVCVAWQFQLGDRFTTIALAVSTGGYVIVALFAINAQRRRDAKAAASG